MEKKIDAFNKNKNKGSFPANPTLSLKFNQPAGLRLSWADPYYLTGLDGQLAITFQCAPSMVRRPRSFNFKIF